MELDEFDLKIAWVSRDHIVIKNIDERGRFNSHVEGHDPNLDPHLIKRVPNYVTHKYLSVNDTITILFNSSLSRLTIKSERYGHQLRLHGVPKDLCH